MTSDVRTAVIPTAGLGTRFLPVTRSVPKVLLPVLSKPQIHFAVSEAARAGLERVVLVVSPGSESVVDYFRPKPVLEGMLKERGKTEELAQQREISSLIGVDHVVQERALGLGHAILMAREKVGNEPFAVFLPDDLIWSEPPAIAQLIDIRHRFGGNVIAAKEVPEHAVEALGIIAGDPVDERAWRVRGLVEKPKLTQAPSNLAIIGRYVLSPEVFEHLEKGRRGAGGEIQVTDAIAARIGQEPVHACLFTGSHIDAGTPAGMYAAWLFEAEKDPELHKAAAEAYRAAKSGS